MTKNRRQRRRSHPHPHPQDCAIPRAPWMRAPCMRSMHAPHATRRSDGDRRPRSRRSRRPRSHQTAVRPRCYHRGRPCGLRAVSASPSVPLRSTCMAKQATRSPYACIITCYVIHGHSRHQMLDWGRALSSCRCEMSMVARQGESSGVDQPPRRPRAHVFATLQQVLDGDRS